MYHINNDRRQISSAKRIKEGLTKCLATKHMSEITVSDIAAASGVSRSSFYRSFDNPIDVLSYACDCLIDRLIEDYSSIHVDSRDEFVLFSLKYWSHHADVIEAIVNCDRLDIMTKAVISRGEDFIIKELGLLYQHFTRDEIDYLKTGLVGMITGLLQVWIRHGKRESPEQLYALYRKFELYSLLFQEKTV